MEPRNGDSTSQPGPTVARILAAETAQAPGPDGASADDAAPTRAGRQPPPTRLGRYLPGLAALLHYRRQDLPGDLLAGAIVAIMLVPQSMAYALLAGLPPQAGLYASILPLVIYPLLGTSPYLGVGPTAIASLLVATGIGHLAAPGSAEYWQLAIVLALLAGLIRIALGLARAGFLVNFISDPVLSGYTSAAALVIAFSQVKHVLGIDLPATDALHEGLVYVVQHAGASNPVTVAIGLGTIALVVGFRNGLGGYLDRLGVPCVVADPLTKGAPFVAVLGGSLLVWALGLHHTAGVKIVGAIPPGLPPLTIPEPNWSIWHTLLPSAFAVAAVGVIESMSVAKSLASKRRQKVDADQELLAVGAANVGAALTGGYPVTGSFSRSVVNFTSGANTGLASIVTALLVAVTVLALTPALYFLPQAVLAGIIIGTIYTLVDVSALQFVWRYNKRDAAALLATFVTVLEISANAGLVVGMLAAMGLYLWRTSRPYVAIVGRVGESQQFRDVLRAQVNTSPYVLLVRVNGSLYFANTKYIEDWIRRAVADHPRVKHVVLICGAVNFVDASAVRTLDNLIQELRDVGVTLHLAEVQDRVLDELNRIDVQACLGDGRIFASTYEAVQALPGEGVLAEAAPAPAEETVAAPPTKKG